VWVFPEASYLQSKERADRWSARSFVGLSACTDSLDQRLSNLVRARAPSS
jgi:hypothetical protein